MPYSNKSIDCVKINQINHFFEMTQYVLKHEIDNLKNEELTLRQKLKKQWNDYENKRLTDAKMRMTWQSPNVHT